MFASSSTTRILAESFPFSVVPIASPLRRPPCPRSVGTGPVDFCEPPEDTVDASDQARPPGRGPPAAGPRSSRRGAVDLRTRSRLTPRRRRRPRACPPPVRRARSGGAPPRARAARAPRPPGSGPRRARRRAPPPPAPARRPRHGRAPREGGAPAGPSSDTVAASQRRRSSTSRPGRRAPRPARRRSAGDPGCARAPPPRPGRVAPGARRGPGSRTVRPVRMRPSVTPWRIHHVAYVENAWPRRWSNSSTARIRPSAPSWTRSSSGRPRSVYRRAIDTTQPHVGLHHQVARRAVAALHAPRQRHLLLPRQARHPLQVRRAVRPATP